MDDRATSLLKNPDDRSSFASSIFLQRKFLKDYFRWGILRISEFEYGSVYSVSGSRRSHITTVQRKRLLDFSKSCRIGRIFGKRVGRWTLVIHPCVDSPEMCYNPIGRKYTKSWNLRLSHIKWGLWAKSVEICVTRMDGEKWCKTFMEWLYPRKNDDFL